MVIIREEDSKREKGKNEMKNDCTTVTELEPNEEMWNTLSISEIKKSTCNIRGIRMFIEVIFEKLHQYFEKIQIKGISDRGIVCIVAPERKLEAAIFEQLGYHLKYNHGTKNVLSQNDQNCYFNTGFEFVQFEKYPKTAISEIIENVFKTVEKDHFKQVAHKGEIVLNLVDRLRSLLKSIYQVPSQSVKITTYLTGISVENLRVDWENSAKLVAGEILDDLEALDKSINDKVAVLDKRPNNVIIDMVHREVRVPLNFENQFGNKIKENDPTLTNECVEAIFEKLSDRILDNENINNEDDSQNLEVLYMIDDVRDMDEDKKVEGYEKVVNEVYKIVNRSVNPEQESEVLIAMGMDEFETTYKTSLSTAYATMPSEAHDSRPAEVKEIETVVETAYDICMKKWENLSNRVRACSDPGAEVRFDGSDEDEDEECTDDDRIDHWLICGKYSTMAVKIGFHKVETKKGPEVTRVKLFKIALNSVHRQLQILCEDGNGEDMLGIRKTVEELIKVRNQFKSLADNQESKTQERIVAESIEFLERVKILESNLATYVETLLQILNEIELGTQYMINKAKETLEKLKDTEDDTLCYATIVEMTLRSVTEYKKLTVGSGLPRVVRFETFCLIKKIARLLVDHCKFKHAFAICSHVTSVKSMWRACLVIRTTLLRFAELRALKISKTRGLKVKFSRREEKSLNQCELVLEQLTNVNLSFRSSRRQDPNPVLTKDVNISETIASESVDEEKESEIAILYGTNPEEIKAADEHERKFVRVLSKILRKHSPKKYISIALNVFVDIPEDFMEITATNGEERLLCYEVQQGKKMIHAIDGEEDLEELVTEEERVKAIHCKEHPKRSIEDIKMYPGLINVEQAMNIVVISEVVEKKLEKEESQGRFYKALHQNSYAKQMLKPTALYTEREISKLRAKYSAGMLYHNCNLGRHCVTGTPFVETGYSCVGNCRPDTKGCLSRNKNFLENVKDNHPHYKKCMSEWSRFAKSNVDMKLLKEIFAGFVNYNGHGVSVEQLWVTNKKTGIQHQVNRVIKPCVLVDWENVNEVIQDLERLSGRPAIVSTHTPEQLGFGDEGWATRPLRTIQNGTLFIPRALGNLVWVITNCRVGVNMIDERTSTPRHKTTNMCKVCHKSYLSPVSLLFHMVYQEEVLGNVNHISGNHDNCNRYKVCKCRLWKGLTKNQFSCEREEFDHYETKNITKNGNREYSKVSRIQLSNLEFLDMSLMPIGQLCDYLVLLNQLGIHCYLAGGEFAKRHKLFISKQWARIAIFGSLYRPLIIKGKNAEDNCLDGEVWKSEKFAGYRLSHEGDILEADVRVQAREMVEVSLNSTTTSERLGSVGFQPMTTRYDPKTEKIKYLEEVEPEELKVLKEFLNLDEEIIYENISRFCLTFKPPKEVEKDYLRKIHILRYIKQNYLEKATLMGKRLPALAMIPIEESKYSTFRSTYDIVYGELVNAMPEKLAREKFTIDLNQLEDGKEIVPGRKFVIEMPENRTEAELDNILDTMEHKRLEIEETGWKGKVNQRPEPSAKRYPQEEFTPVPTKENEALEKERREKKKNIEIQNKENINRLRNSWWCYPCELRRNRSQDHKEGCYWGIMKAKDKMEKRKAEQSINDLIKESREAREAQESGREPNKSEIKERIKADGTKIEKKTKKKKSKGILKTAQVRSTGCSENLLANCTIQELDREAEECSQAEFVRACTDQQDLGKFESLKDLTLKATEISKELEDIENKCKKFLNIENVPESIEKEIGEPVVNQDQIMDELSKIETLTKAIMSGNVREDQRHLAKEVFEEVRSKILNEIGQESESSSEVIIEEMEQIEELSDQEDDTTEEAMDEGNASEHMDNVVQAQDVLPSWCPGGYNEDTMEIDSCGNVLCNWCNY